MQKPLNTGLHLGRTSRRLTARNSHTSAEQEHVGGPSIGGRGIGGWGVLAGAELAGTSAAIRQSNTGSDRSPGGRAGSLVSVESLLGSIRTSLLEQLRAAPSCRAALTRGPTTPPFQSADGSKTSVCVCVCERLVWSGLVWYRMGLVGMPPLGGLRDRLKKSRRGLEEKQASSTGCLAARPRSSTSREVRPEVSPEVRPESTLPDSQRPLNPHQVHLGPGDAAENNTPTSQTSSDSFIFKGFYSI